MGALHNNRAIALVLLLQAVSVSAQDDAWLKSHGSSPRYYEGLLDVPNGRPSYEVIGFFAFGEQKDTLSGEAGLILHALYFVPAQPPPVTSVFVQVKQISSRTNYLLLSKPDSLDKVPNAWNDLSWGTKPVIAHNGIDPNKLGVIAKLNSNDAEHGTFAPVIFTENLKPTHINHYELFLKLQRYSVASLSYVISGPVTRQCFYSLTQPCLSKSPLHPDAIEVGTVIRLPLSIESGPGDFSIRIHGQYKDTDEVLEPAFSFHHEPAYLGSR